MESHLEGNAALRDISDTVAQLALQGPKAEEILARLADAEDIPTRYYSFVQEGVVGGIRCLISRTGYTGEKGYELYCANSDAPALWNALMDAGKEYGLIPCGLGARDTLRLEAAMPLYGHEMDEDTSPLEAGLGAFVRMDKPSFIGKAAIVQKGAPAVRRVGLEITGRGIAREGCLLYQGERQAGRVTSGTYCPYVGKAVAMALVPNGCAALDTVFEADVRGRRIAAKVVPLPFFKK